MDGISLNGSFPMSVDSKARITLPANFRKAMDVRTIKLVPFPFDGCVLGFTPEGFDDWKFRLFNRDGKTYDERNRSEAKLMRMLNASVVDVEIDTAGRIALGKLDASQPGTREKYGLMKDVRVIGNGDHFEIWGADQWVNEQDDSDDLASLFYR